MIKPNTGLFSRMSLRNKYLSLVIMTALLTISTIVSAQWVRPYDTFPASPPHWDTTRNLQVINGDGFYWTGKGKFGGGLIIPLDTFKLACKDSGSLALKNGSLYVWRCLFWDKVQGGDGTFDNQSKFIGSGGISLTDSTVTIAGPIYWSCEGSIDFQTGSFTTSIPAEPTGYQRTDQIYIDCSTGTIDTSKGQSDTVRSILRQLPTGAILVSIIDVQGGVISSPTFVSTYQRTSIAYIGADGKLTADSTVYYVDRATGKLYAAGTIESGINGGVAFQMKSGSAVRSDGRMYIDASDMLIRTGSVYEHITRQLASGNVVITSNVLQAEEPSAKLDVSSTTKGVLIPRMTTAQRNAIISPATSLLIYNSTLDSFQYYRSGWRTIGGGGGSSFDSTYIYDSLTRMNKVVHSPNGTLDFGYSVGYDSIRADVDTAVMATINRLNETVAALEIGTAPGAYQDYEVINDSAFSLIKGSGDADTINIRGKDLQGVTDVGATTTNTINIGGLIIPSLAASDYYLKINGSGIVGTVEPPAPIGLDEAATNGNEILNKNVIIRTDPANIAGAELELHQDGGGGFIRTRSGIPTVTTDYGAGNILYKSNIFNYPPYLQDSLFNFPFQFKLNDIYYKANDTGVVDLGTITGGSGTITALTGDVTASGTGSVASTLATVNGNVGSFGSATQVPTYTVNGKGLITAASNTSIQIAESQVTNLTTDLGNKWGTSGNSGLTGSNFVGTTDNIPFKFRMNNVQYLSIDTMTKCRICMGNYLTYPTLSRSYMAISDTQDVTSGTTYINALFLPTYRNTGSTYHNQALIGIASELRFAASNTSSYNSGYAATPGRFTINAQLGAAGTLNLGTGLYTGADWGGMTMTQFSGLTIDNPFVHDGGAITTNWGLQIKRQTAGTNNGGFLDSAQNNQIIAGTLINGNNALFISATQPPTITAASYGVNVQVTSGGSSSFANGAMNVANLAGYTGSLTTSGITVSNVAAGIGTGVYNAAQNRGISITVTGSTVGTNAGGIALASNGAINVGWESWATSVSNNRINVGFMAAGRSSATGGIGLGGYITNDTITTPNFLAAGLQINTGNQTHPILLAQSSGATVFTVTSTGAFSAGTASAPAASAILDLVSTTKGLLLPRMTSTQGSAISSPADGLQIYVTDTDATFTSIGFWGRENGAWIKL